MKTVKVKIFLLLCAVFIVQVSNCQFIREVMVSHFTKDYAPRNYNLRAKLSITENIKIDAGISFFYKNEGVGSAFYTDEPLHQFGPYLGIYLFNKDLGKKFTYSLSTSAEYFGIKYGEEGKSVKINGNFTHDFTSRAQLYWLYANQKLSYAVFRGFNISMMMSFGYRFVFYNDINKSISGTSYCFSPGIGYVFK